MYLIFLSTGNMQREREASPSDKRMKECEKGVCVCVYERSRENEEEMNGKVGRDEREMSIPNQCAFYSVGWLEAIDSHRPTNCE